MKTRSTELSVGILGIVGLLAIGGFILQYGKIGDKVKGTYPLQVEISDANGIRKGVPVRLGGLQVGYVSDAPKLKEDYSALDLPLAIFDEFKIPKNSIITIGTTGLMGDSFVKITLPKEITGEFIQPDSSLPMGDSDGLVALQSDVESLLTDMSATLVELNKTIKNLDRTFEKVDYLTSAENLQTISETMNNLATSSENIRDASIGLAPLMTTAGESMDEIRKTSIDLREISRKIDPVLGKANESLTEFQSAAVNLNTVSTKLDPVVVSAQNTLSEVEEAAQVAKRSLQTVDVDLDKGIDAIDDIATAVKKADPAINQLEGTLVQMQSTLENVDNFAANLKTGNGLLRELHDNPEFRDDFIDLVDKLETNGLIFYPREKKYSPPKRKFRHPKLSASR